jgi:hypothetical protein
LDCCYLLLGALLFSLFFLLSSSLSHQTWNHAKDYGLPQVHPPCRRHLFKRLLNDEPLYLYIIKAYGLVSSTTRSWPRVQQNSTALRSFLDSRLAIEYGRKEILSQTFRSFRFCLLLLLLYCSVIGPNVRPFKGSLT